MDALLAVLAGNVVLVVIGYIVVRFAIVSAMRQARHEARVEQELPAAATWLNKDEKALLERTKRDS
ncbi:hypothetical protein [uncultured Microbacterium sp.]|uniref:hypothetical protein n=1 Tax=uncultured Microbacterium sp. TaxID=191216 RepID=UPI002630A413|nr:hypothetical protein [uncultured Microbacterium sp.]